MRIDTLGDDEVFKEAAMPTADERIDLNVPFREKDDAKALGARWDAQQRVWYAPRGVDLGPLAPWLPAQTGILETTGEPDTAEPQGLSLVELLNRARRAVRDVFQRPEWVRAEITEIRWRDQGYAFVRLAQHDGEGHTIADSGGRLWRPEATSVTEKFRNATGSDLAAGMQVLLSVDVELHPVFGLQLTIRDIDPNYTLGDLEAKRRRAREALKSEGVYTSNHARSLPLDFTRVAVLSPQGAAGLGDFLGDARLLAGHRLCEFVYFTAVFQGERTSEALITALEEINARHLEQAFDALIVIRGGGSAVDLAWLDDVDVARRLCNSPLPVFTGIGHERDNTLLDEVARQRFDTPSKVAAHIFSTITDNARAAIEHYRAVQQYARARISDGRLRTERDWEQVGTAAVTVARSGREAVYRVHERTVTGAWQVIREGRAHVDDGMAGLADDARRLPALALRAMHIVRQAMSQDAKGEIRAIRSDLGRSMWETVRIARTAPVHARRRLEHEQAAVAQAGRFPLRRLGDDLDTRVRDIQRDGQTLMRWARRSTREHRAVLGKSARALARDARRTIDDRMGLVLNLGPHATLQRGYAIVREPSGGQVVTDVEQARGYGRLNLEFRDGRVVVHPINNEEMGDE